MQVNMCSIITPPCMFVYFEWVTAKWKIWLWSVGCLPHKKMCAHTRECHNNLHIEVVVKCVTQFRSADTKWIVFYFFLRSIFPSTNSPNVHCSLCIPHELMNSYNVLSNTIWSHQWPLGSQGQWIPSFLIQHYKISWPSNWKFWAESACLVSFPCLTQHSPKNCKQLQKLWNTLCM